VKCGRDVWSSALVSGNPFQALSKPCSQIRREQDKEATVYIGNLDERVTDSLVWELMLQAGRIVNVHLPKDRVTQTHQGYGFVEFISEEDAEYAARIMNQVRLYGKPIRVNKASADKQKSVEVGAELFVGNLDPMVTEQVLYDTFGRFGGLIAAPKVCLQPLSRGKCPSILRKPRLLEMKTTCRRVTALCPSRISNPPTKR
jgi:RNA recognition motif-containing protein